MLAAQFGYLPGTLWIIIGGVLGGAAQDFVTLFGSLRRDGKSLGQMAREEIAKPAGFAAFVTVLLIMIIMLGVMALVVVNALKGKPVGRVHHRGHHPDRFVHGPLPALLAARQSAGMLSHRCRSGDGGDLRGVCGSRAITHRLCARTVQVTVSWRCAKPLPRIRPPKKTFLTMAMRPSVWARRRCNRLNFQEPKALLE